MGGNAFIRKTTKPCPSLHFQRISKNPHHIIPMKYVEFIHKWKNKYDLTDSWITTSIKNWSLRISLILEICFIVRKPQDAREIDGRIYIRNYSTVIFIIHNGLSVTYINYVFCTEMELSNNEHLKLYYVVWAHLHTTSLNKIMRK